MIQFQLITDRNGKKANHPIKSDYVDARVLSGTTAEAHTIPAGAKFVEIVGTAAFYVNFGGTAVAPAADVTNGTASAYMIANTPRIFDVVPGETIGLVGVSGGTITMTFWS